MGSFGTGPKNFPIFCFSQTGGSPPVVSAKLFFSPEKGKKQKNRRATSPRPPPPGSRPASNQKPPTGTFLSSGHWGFFPLAQFRGDTGEANNKKTLPGRGFSIVFFGPGIWDQKTAHNGIWFGCPPQRESFFLLLGRPPVVPFFFSQHMYKKPPPFLCGALGSPPPRFSKPGGPTAVTKKKGLRSKLRKNFGGDVKVPVSFF